MPPVLAKPRKDFSADALFRLTRSYFCRMDDPRQGKISILLGDALMSAFAMFSLKDPSLLAFDERCRNQNYNFRTIYGIESVPSDTQMRAILDTVDPDDLRPLYNDIFRLLQRGKELEQFVFMCSFINSIKGVAGSMYLTCETEPKNQVPNTDKFCLFNNPPRMPASWLQLACRHRMR